MDAAFELAVGLALVLLRADFAVWWDIPEAAVVVIGVVFLAAFVGLAVLIFVPIEPVVLRALAFGNIGAGIAGWLLFAVFFGRFEPEGRWTLAAIADAFVLVGIAEWLVSSRSEP